MDELNAGQRVELDLMREEYQRRYGIGVEYIKSLVGLGERYENAVARAVVSDNGAWFECIEQPMEFSGAAGCAPAHRFITDRDALEFVRHLNAMAHTVSDAGASQIALLLIYARAGVADRKGAYVVQRGRASGDGKPSPLTIGDFRPDTLPLLFRCKFDIDLSNSGLPFPRGVVFGLTGIGERNLLVELAYEGGDMRDLGALPAGDRSH